MSYCNHGIIVSDRFGQRCKICGEKNIPSLRSAKPPSASPSAVARVYGPSEQIPYVHIVRLVDVSQLPVGTDLVPASELAKAQQEREALKAEIAGLRADAERYAFCMEQYLIECFGSFGGDPDEVNEFLDGEIAKLKTDPSYETDIPDAALAKPGARE